MANPIRPHQIGAAILAAGQSRRMGTCKALLEIAGVSFLQRVARLYSNAGIAAVAVVNEDLEPSVRSMDLAGADVMVNPRPSDGPLSSLLLALRLLEPASALLPHPVDHPLVSIETVRTLAAEHRRTPSCILLPCHHGVKGHPTLFPRRFFPDLRSCPADQGARWAVRQNRASTLRVEVDDPGILANLNRPADLERFGVRGSRPRPRS